MNTDNNVQLAVSAFASGNAVVLFDDLSSRTSGYLTSSAEKASTQLVSFMVRHTSGFICVALCDSDCTRLDLPQQCSRSANAASIEYAVSVDSNIGIGTGISAKDRALTIRLLSDPLSAPNSFTRPGHVVPLRIREGGVLVHPGHAEASADLAKLAGGRAVGVFSQLIRDEDGSSLIRVDEARLFAQKHQLAFLTISQLVLWRRLNEKMVSRVAEARIPTEHGEFVSFLYRDDYAGDEHIAFIRGTDSSLPSRGLCVPVYIHKGCFLGDIFRSTLCGCFSRLNSAMGQISQFGDGVIIYLRNSRSCKCNSSQSQFEGCSPWYLRQEECSHTSCSSQSDYRASFQILSDLKIESMYLLNTGNRTEISLETYHDLVHSQYSEVES